jgi:hypothetical protein
VAQKHRDRLSKPAAVSQGTWSAPHTVFADSPVLMLGLSVAYRRRPGTRFSKSWSSSESRVRGSLHGDGCCLHGYCEWFAGCSRVRATAGPPHCGQSGGLASSRQQPSGAGSCLVHSSDACGSPQVAGSTSSCRSSSNVASLNVSFFRPPPGRRTRLAATSVATLRNSARPRPIVLRAIPVTRGSADSHPILRTALRPPQTAADPARPGPDEALRSVPVWPPRPTPPNATRPTAHAGIPGTQKTNRFGYSLTSPNGFGMCTIREIPHKDARMNKPVPLEVSQAWYHVPSNPASGLRYGPEAQGRGLAARRPGPDCGSVTSKRTCGASSQWRETTILPRAWCSEAWA